jgi:hypothetical protein
VKGILIVSSGALFLIAAWIGVYADSDARRYLPRQFADELASRYYMQYALFDRAIPLAIRRRLAVSAALATIAWAGFTAAAYVFGNPTIAMVLLLICGFGIANVFWQWRRARR